MSEDLADRIEALDVVEVTQADREAAADVWRDYIARIGEVMAEKAIRKGISDDTIIVQAFARHRITALRLAETSAALPDDVAKLKKQLQDEYSLNGGQGAYAWRSRELCGKAAAGSPVAICEYGTDGKPVGFATGIAGDDFPADTWVVAQGGKLVPAP